MSGAWIQTLRGRVFDLIEPTADMVDFAEVAECLGKIARFNGHTKGFYSVAQHCVRGADAIESVTKDSRLAGLFLLHDAHEAYIGDITTPVVSALGHHVSGGRLGVARLKSALDAVIWTAAGVGVPVAHARRHEIALWDMRMLNAERRDLLAPSPRLWGAAIEFFDCRMIPRITPWSWDRAAGQWLDRFHDFFPNVAA